MTKALKVIGICLGTSFASLLLGVILFPESAGAGVMTWFVGTLIYPSYKLFPHLAKYDRHVEKLREERNKPDASFGSDYSSDFDPDEYVEKEAFRNWTHENLLWSGKRKLVIEYQDRHGKITERDIEMLGIWPHHQTGEICFRAKCLLRDDWRTFKGDNVLSVRNARKKTFDSFSSYISEELGI